MNEYVVVLRNRLRKIKYIIEVDDHRGVDAATLEFFSIQTHNKYVSFSVNDKSCNPLSRTLIKTHKDSQLVLTLKGRCSKTCGEGFRLLEYSCKRPMNADLCRGDHLGLATGEKVDKLKVWRSCNEKECYDFEKYLQEIIITNMTVALGERVRLTCLDKEYIFRIKENMPSDGQPEVHWFKNEKHYHQQKNSIIVRVQKIEDTGLYHCYVRYNRGRHYAVKMVGIIPDNSERYVMLLNKYEFEMRADYVLFVL